MIGFNISTQRNTVLSAAPSRKPIPYSFYDPIQPMGVRESFDPNTSAFKATLRLVDIDNFSMKI